MSDRACPLCGGADPKGQLPKWAHTGLLGGPRAIYPHPAPGICSAEGEGESEGLQREKWPVPAGSVGTGKVTQ